VSVTTNQEKSELENNLNEMIEAAVSLEKWPVARLVSMFEAEPAFAEGAEKAAAKRQHIFDRLDQLGKNKNALVIGITGTPGAGKSSLISELCLQLLATNPALSAAVIAVDPSSQQSGGALLGDRTRVKFPANDKRLFFRSQANHLNLGGLGKKTFLAVRLLRRLFDVVIIETVGIGQSEMEIDQLSDLTCLVLQPLSGDQVQFMKAGIMEIPDIFIVNKCDEDELAQQSYHLLKSSLKLIRITVDKNSKDAKPVFLTSALKKKGIDQIAEFILKQKQDPGVYKNSRDQENYFLKKWIYQNYGNYGLEVYKQYNSDNDNNNEGDIPNGTPCNQAYEHKIRSFNKVIATMVRPLGNE